VYLTVPNQYQTSTKSVPNHLQIISKSSPAAAANLDLANILEIRSFPTILDVVNEFDGFPESGNPFIEREMPITQPITFSASQFWLEYHHSNSSHYALLHPRLPIMAGMPSFQFFSLHSLVSETANSGWNTIIPILFIKYEMPIGQPILPLPITFG
jgi:hypothetical protein